MATTPPNPIDLHAAALAALASAAAQPETVERSGIAHAAEHFRRTRWGDGSGVGGPSRPYEQVPAMFRAVSFIAEGVSMMPLVVSTADDRIIEQGPIADLVEQPHPTLSREEFWYQTVGWMLLASRVHWLIERSGGGGSVRSMLPVGGPQMRAETDDLGRIVRWWYRPAGARSNRELSMDPADVHTISTPKFDPADPHNGISPAEVARRALAQVYKSDLANESVLDNGVEPGGVFRMDGLPSELQVGDLRAQLEERYAGASNRRRPLLLYGGLEWQQTAATFADMEFSALQKAKAADICVAMGIDAAAILPPEGGRYEFVRAAKASAWIDRIIPLAARLAGHFERAALRPMDLDRSLSVRSAMAGASTRAISRLSGRSLGRRAAQVRRRPGQSLYAWFDDATVPAVQEARLSTVEAVRKWVEMGVPLNAAIRAADAPYEEVPWGDTWYRPIGVVDVREDVLDTAPGASGEPTGPAGDPPGGGPEDLGEQQAPVPPPPPMPVVERGRVQAMQERQRRRWQGYEKVVRGRVRRHFLGLRAAVLRRLDQRSDDLAKALTCAAEERTIWPIEPGPWDDSSFRPRQVRIPARSRAVILDVLVDVQEAGGRLRASVMPTLREAARRTGQEAMDESARLHGQALRAFDDTATPVIDALRQREIRLADANRTLRTRLANTLASGVGEGEAVTQLADRVKAEFNFAYKRAGTIARTETHAVVEQARLAGMNQGGARYKSWLWSRKEQGRRNHAQTEHQTLGGPVPIDQPFRIAGSGVLAMAPGESGDPAEDINCACTVIPRSPGDGLGGTFPEGPTPPPQSASADADAMRVRRQMAELQADAADGGLRSLHDAADAAESRLTAATDQYVALAQEQSAMTPGSEPWREIESAKQRLMAARDAAIAERIQHGLAYERQYARLNARCRELVLGEPVFQPKVILNPRLTSAQAEAVHEGVRMFTRLCGIRDLEGIEVRCAGTASTRPGYRGGVILLPRNVEPVQVLHELGHVLEHRRPHLAARAKAFWRQRTASDAERDLAEATGNRLYRGERFKPDRFIDPYMGKVYHGNATEIISVGLEYLWTQPLRLVSKDPGYFDFVYGLLRPEGKR
jgi:HK97 family phage portal protein